MQHQPGRPVRKAFCLNLTLPHLARLADLAIWAGLTRTELIRRWIDAQHEAALAARQDLGARQTAPE